MALTEEESKLSIRCMLSVYLSVLPFLYSSCFSFSTVCRCFLQFVQPVRFIYNKFDSEALLQQTRKALDRSVSSDVILFFAVIATVALAFLLLPMCQYIIRPCSDGNKISFGICGRFTGAELLSFSLSVSIVCIWVLTGHWLLMDAMGMGLCVAFIAFVRLPSLKVSTLLLTGLLIYDVFWVFFSSYIFSTNVMVKVTFINFIKIYIKEHITLFSNKFMTLFYLRYLFYDDTL